MHGYQKSQNGGDVIYERPLMVSLENIELITRDIFQYFLTTTMHDSYNQQSS